MLFIKYFTSCILFTFSLSTFQIAIAAVVEKKCGEYIFQVKMINGLDLDEKQFELYYKEKGKKKKLFYRTNSAVYLYAMCIKNNKNQELMFFQESYGGNVGPEDMYGVFDPRAKKMLIKPSDWPKGNEKQVQEIIGYPPPYIGGKDDASFFCCFRYQYTKKI